MVFSFLSLRVRIMSVSLFTSMAMGADDKSGPSHSNELLEDFMSIEIDHTSKRQTCEKCRRPRTGCYCPLLCDPPLDPASTVFILQHPHEEKRCLRTVPVLCHSLVPEKCHVIKGKRFHPGKNARIKEMCEADNSVLLYPAPDAQDIDDVVRERGTGDYNIVLLDGTWAQARGMYLQNQCLQQMKKVNLKNAGLSEYVIRTQPADGSLSTLESAAVALSVLEGRPDFKEKLTRPLRALCQIQLDHGAVVHHSKQFLKENGLYVKQGTNGYSKQSPTVETKEESESDESEMTEPKNE